MSKSIRTIVYIAGYGRSGSTLLDLILNTGKCTFGLGEVTNLFSEYAENKVQQPWKAIVEETMAHYLINPTVFHEASKRVETYNVRGNALDNYRKIWSHIFERLYIQYPGVYVDSSKTVYRSFYRPQQFLNMGWRVKMVHLIRHPYAVMDSVSKGSNRKLESKSTDPSTFGGEYRAFLNWYFTNFRTKIHYKRLLGNNYTQIMYEDLMENFAQTINYLSTFLEIDYDPQIIASTDLKEYEDIGISGNRMRRSERIIVQRKEPKYKINDGNRFVRHLISRILE